MKHLALATLTIALLVPAMVMAAREREMPRELPTKGQRRTYIDMSEDAPAIKSKIPGFDRAFERAQKEHTTETIRPRGKIVAAPQGDSSEILKDMRVLPESKMPEPKVQARAKTESQKAEAVSVSAPEPATVPSPVQMPVPTTAPPTATTETKKTDLVLPPVTPQAVAESQGSPPPSRVFVPSYSMQDEFEMAKTAPVITTTVETPAPKKSAEEGQGTLVFVRAGYLQAKYSKFDARMKDSATSIGLGGAHSFDTQWGAFEARAAFDVFHAGDQSVSVENIRMLSTRTEVGYWLSRSRVRPGVSLGLGWAEYSIRSYRSVNGSDVTVRNHANGQAFTLIPASALRIDLGAGLVLDLQTEYLALLGGENSDAAQGLAATAALGWTF